MFFSLYFETFWQKWLTVFINFKTFQSMTEKWPEKTGWSNNSANSHPSPGAFNRRLLRACLVPQCSHPPYWLTDFDSVLRYWLLRIAYCSIADRKAVLIYRLTAFLPLTPCELWLDACGQHQRTTFLSSQASNLLSFVAVEPHCL